MVVLKTNREKEDYQRPFYLAKEILLDFSRVRHFEYFGLAVLMDILFQYKKSRRIEVGLHGLSPECLAVANHLGLERVLKS